MTSGGILLDEYEAGDIFKIGDKEYILSEIILWIFRMERIFIIWNIQVIISLGKRLSENNGQKRISKEDTDMSMTGISNSYNNYVTQNTNDTTKKNVAKSNSRQVEFKEFNSEIKEPKLSTVAKMF